MTAIRDRIGVFYPKKQAKKLKLTGKVIVTITINCN
jgi:hypothetical protein